MSQLSLSLEMRFSGENSQVFPSPEALRSPFTALQWTFLDQDGCQWHLATDVRLGHWPFRCQPLIGFSWCGLRDHQPMQPTHTYIYLYALPIFGFVWMGNLKTSERSGQEVENRTDYMDLSFRPQNPCFDSFTSLKLCLESRHAKPGVAAHRVGGCIPQTALGLSVIAQQSEVQSQEQCESKIKAMWRFCNYIIRQFLWVKSSTNHHNCRKRAKYGTEPGETFADILGMCYA